MQLKHIQVAISRDYPAVTEACKAADSDTADTLYQRAANNPDRQLLVHQLEAEAFTCMRRGQWQERATSQELSRRAWAAFHAAGLCDGPPPAPHARSAGIAGHPAAAALLPLTSYTNPALILAAERVRSCHVLATASLLLLAPYQLYEWAKWTSTR